MVIYQVKTQVHRYSKPIYEDVGGAGFHVFVCECCGDKSGLFPAQLASLPLCMALCSAGRFLGLLEYWKAKILGGVSCFDSEIDPGSGGGKKRKKIALRSFLQQAPHKPSFEISGGG